MSLPSYEDYKKEHGIEDDEVDESKLEPCTDEEFAAALNEVLDEMTEELKDSYSDEAIEAEIEANKDYYDELSAAKTYEEKLAVDKKYKRGVYAQTPDYDGLPYIE